MIQGAQTWLKPLYRLMHQHLCEQDVLHADETTLQVLREPGRAAQTTSYIWLYRTGRHGPPVILYEYQPTRDGEHPRTFLSDFQGYLHVDGYLDTIRFRELHSWAVGAIHVASMGGS